MCLILKQCFSIPISRCSEGVEEMKILSGRHLWSWQNPCAEPNAVFPILTFKTYCKDTLGSDENISSGNPLGIYQRSSAIRSTWPAPPRAKTLLRNDYSTSGTKIDVGDCPNVPWHCDIWEFSISTPPLRYSMHISSRAGEAFCEPINKSTYKFS